MTDQTTDCAVRPVSATTADGIVVGTGATGLAAAAALAATGFNVCLIGPPPAAIGRDTRTAALFPASIEMLRTLGAWSALADLSAPLKAIRLVDDTESLLRAPEVLFSASEAGLDTFGFNVPNAALTEALAQVVRSMPRISWHDAATADAIETGADKVCAVTSAGRFEAALLVAADGRSSICRAAAGIAVKAWDYPQSAIATSFAHSRRHDGISTEFHRQAGPFTTVPMPGNWSSLVWVERPAIAARLMAMSEADFRAALETRLHGLLGTVGEISARRAFPLSGLEAESLGRNRIALVGEAAHVIPPIGAQGLNLGLRDVAALAETLATARSRRTDIGTGLVLAAYHQVRARDVASRTHGVDLLNRSLLSELLPVQLARGAGLHALRTIAPLRRWAMAAGMAPPGAMPRLMQPGGGGLIVA